ncbi:MAG: hypothetical protein IPG99_13030 [Ignavibacteria bacterium]|nr:hypothetical protein [Ignavibacteria bacterium]
MNDISYEATGRELAGLIATANKRLTFYAGRNNKFSAIRLAVFIAAMIVTIYLFTVSVSIGWGIVCIKKDAQQILAKGEIVISKKTCLC